MKEKKVDTDLWKTLTEKALKIGEMDSEENEISSPEYNSPQTNKVKLRE